MDRRLVQMRERFEAYLKDVFQSGGEPQKVLFEAMEYSLLGGGKRIRPLLLLQFCAACGGNWKDALPLAAAIEMVHTYSLIHDDLPAMDDDDLRRGRPTNHIVFGEANAILAGDGLLTAAFETALGPESVGNLGYERAARAAVLLAARAGAFGMVGGQVLDIAAERAASVTEEDLMAIHSRKTGALIEAACLMGGIAAGASEEQLGSAAHYARCVGLAFQIRDDVLDAEGDPKKLGKNVGSDEARSMTTFYTLYGAEGCKERIARLTEGAREAVKPLDPEGILQTLADELAGREI